MSASPDDTSAPTPREQDAWADDPWKRDDWKNADWGKPAAPPSDAPTGPRKRGLAAYNAGMIEAGPYLTFGLQIAFSMVFFVGLGYVLDRFLGSTPWGMVGGAAIGMVAVFTLIARMAREADAKQRAKREASKGDAR